MVKEKKVSPKMGGDRSYFIIALRSSSGVLRGIMLNLSTSTLSMFGVMNAGRLGPKRMSFIPSTAATARWQRLSVHTMTAPVKAANR